MVIRTNAGRFKAYRSQDVCYPFSMQVVKAALEAYAKYYATLGIELNEAQAEELVRSVVDSENPEPKPFYGEVRQLTDDFIRRTRELPKQPV